MKYERIRDSRNTKRFIFLCLLVVSILSLHLGCSVFIKRVDHFKTCLPYQWVGNIDQVNFEDPSGIVFHSGRETLFVVGNRGDICEIQRDGTLVKQERIRDADFEGITYDPSTGLLYIAIEGEEKIIEVDPADFRVLREFTIERTFRGSTVLKAGGNGIEAITFVPNSNHPEGGTFYITNQGFDLDNKEDPSALFEIEVPLRSGTSEKGAAKIVKYVSFDVVDLSGLCYEKKSNHIYVISGVANTLFEITRDGKILKTCTLPGDNQEGIAEDESGFLYIAQDSGGIIKVKWDRQR